MLARRPREGRVGRRPGEGGYALVALMALVGIGVMFFLVRQFSGVGGQGPRQEAALDALLVAKQALIGYAATYRDSHADDMFGYLPCPDTNGDGSADPPCGAAGQSAVGFLPYRTLGLADLRDESGACLWYAVSANFKNNPKTAAAFNWDLQGNFQVRTSAGAVRLAPEDAEGGGAAIVFAAGPPLPGQNRTGGTAVQRCGGDAAAAYAAYLESAAFGAGPVAAGTVTLTEGDPAAGNNNDRFVWITPRELFTAIKTRSDFATDLNALAMDIRHRFEGQALLPAPVSGSAAGTKISGGIAATVAAGYFPDSASSPDYYPNWSGQFRYAVCSNQKVRCLNGGACTGVLLFGGERPAGGPRTAAEAGSTASFLDIANLASFTGAGTLFAGAPSFTVANPRLGASADVMYCLNPPEVSFAKDMADFVDTTPSLRITGVAGTQGLASRDATALTLGNDNATTGHTDADTGHALVTGQLFGCSWYGNTIAFGTGVRIYFRFRIENNTAGEGFTLTLADNSTNPSTAMCGSGGEYLGYAGTNANAAGVPYTAPIVTSKLALEFDTHQDAGRSDTNARHVALVYWGQAYDIVTFAPFTSDDNLHHTPPPTTGFENLLGPDYFNLTSPLNTKRATLTCLNSSTVCPTAADRSFLVRMDIVRAYTPLGGAVTRGTGSYSIKAWVVKGTSADDFAGIDNVAVDFSGTSSANYLESGSILLPPTVYLADTVSFQDLNKTAEVFRNFRVGFTVGQGTTGQRFTVTDFKLKTR